LGYSAHPDPTPGLREVEARDVPDWNARAVQGPGGDVYQSVEWAEHWQRWSSSSWRPRLLLFDDGLPLLSLERRWPLISGRGAYLPRGPVSAGEPADLTAARLAAAFEFLVARGVDVVSSDAAIQAATGYGGLIEAFGFRSTEEIEPSRHRLTLPLDRDEDALYRRLATSTRQRAGSAERHGLTVIRYDARPGPESWDGFEPSGADSADPRQLLPVMDRFYDLLALASHRRDFRLAPRARVTDWLSHAVAAGLAVHLEIRAPDKCVLAAALFFRHGGRLTYAHSGDRDDRRHEYPGVVHLMLWRAIQLARREGLAEMDLGGVDVVGRRGRPQPGDPMYGLYAFKASFGGQWVELAGNHERVARPLRYLGGRLAGRIVRAKRNSLAVLRSLR
jgi:lipid II:glycine glycyltransferase (peptidoglycan interpeptide bridge formation enzyme)